MNDASVKKSKRERINILLNDEERKIIKEKAKKYGYGDNVAEYVRNACIYEKIYVEDVKGKQEICRIIDEFITEIRKIQKFQLSLNKNITIPKTDLQKIQKQNQNISELIEKLTKATISTLSSNSTQKFQQRMRLIDKYKVTNNFIDYVLNHDYVIVMPSSLSIKKYKKGYLVINMDSKQTLNVDFISYNPISSMIDSQRELALNNNCYLLLKKIDSELHSYLVYYNQSKELAVKDGNREGKYLLYDFTDKNIYDLKEANHTYN